MEAGVGPSRQRFRAPTQAGAQMGAVGESHSGYPDWATATAGERG